MFDLGLGEAMRILPLIVFGRLKTMARFLCCGSRVDQLLMSVDSVET